MILETNVGLEIGGVLVFATPYEKIIHRINGGAEWGSGEDLSVYFPSKELHNKFFEAVEKIKSSKTLDDNSLDLFLREYYYDFNKVMIDMGAGKTISAYQILSDLAESKQTTSPAVQPGISLPKVNPLIIGGVVAGGLIIFSLMSALTKRSVAI